MKTLQIDCRVHRTPFERINRAAILPRLQPHRKVTRSQASRRYSQLFFSCDDERERRHRSEVKYLVTSPITANASNVFIQRVLSPMVFVIGVNVGITVILIVLTVKLVYAIQRYLISNPFNYTTSESKNSSNRSTKQGGSQTALLALWGRSQSYLMGLPGAADNLSPQLMSQLSLFGQKPPTEESTMEYELSKALTSICAKLSILGHKLTGEIFEDQIAYLASMGNTGLVSLIHCRTRFMDEVVKNFAETHVSCATNTTANVVILGSGYDTRAYRMQCLQNPSMNVYEVDAEGTLCEKKRVIMSLLQPNWERIRMPTYVRCNFENQNWMECMLDEGFNTRLPTLVIWEGVTMYLSLDAIQQTLSIIANNGSIIDTSSDTCSADWYIAFDYLNPDWADTQLWRFAMKFAKEPFQSSLTKLAAEELIVSSGLKVVKHLTERGDTGREDEFDGMSGKYGGFLLAKSWSW